MVFKGEVLRNGVRCVCEVCGTDIGFLTYDELIGIAHMGYEKLVCFDCDGLENDVIPGHLSPSYTESIFINGLDIASDVNTIAIGWNGRINPPFVVGVIVE